MENITTQEYQTITPYLIIPGAVKFIRFLQDVFGATEKYKAMRTEDTVMHAEMIIGNSTIMLADSTDEHSSQPAGLFINVPDADATFQKAVDAGATVIMPPADQDYGRSGGVKDAFGNTWWITTVK